MRMFGLDLDGTTTWFTAPCEKSELLALAAEKLLETDPALGEEETGIALTEDQLALYMAVMLSEDHFWQVQNIYATMGDPTPFEWFEAQNRANLAYELFLRMLLKLHGGIFKKLIEEGDIVLSVRTGGKIVKRKLRTGDQRKHPGFPHQFFPRPKFTDTLNKFD